MCGIALALDMAIQYFVRLDSTDHLEKVFILTDCQAAIDTVVNRREVRFSSASEDQASSRFIA